MKAKSLVLIAGLSLASSANALDYFNVKVTGVGISTAGNYIRFTIDQDPNVILTTDGFTDDKLRQVTALIISAYTAQSPVYYVRSSETTAGMGGRYTSLEFLSLGTQTWD